MKIVGTAIITDEQNRILIGKRPEGKALAGFWEFPGGKQEEGESIENCVIREIKEELNVCCKVGKFILDVTKQYPHGEFKLMVYFAKISDMENLKPNVHQELRWASVTELKNFQFPPADDVIIKYLEEKL